MLPPIGYEYEDDRWSNLQIGARKTQADMNGDVYLLLPHSFMVFSLTKQPTAVYNLPSIDSWMAIGNVFSVLSVWTAIISETLSPKLPVYERTRP